MTIIINLYGGPGTGKSTTSADLFAQLKREGVNAELVSEYVKQWAWERRKPVNYDQFYFFGKQSRKEYSLFDQVDVVVTDSPVPICAYYAKAFGTPKQAELFVEMTKVYYQMCENDGHTHVHYFLNRVKPYNPSGRFQTEAQAKQIDFEMKLFLVDSLGLSLTYIDADQFAAAKIVELVKHEI